MKSNLSKILWATCWEFRSAKVIFFFCLCVTNYPSKYGVNYLAIHEERNSPAPTQPNPHWANKWNPKISPLLLDILPKKVYKWCFFWLPILFFNYIEVFLPTFWFSVLAKQESNPFVWKFERTSLESSTRVAYCVGKMESPLNQISNFFHAELASESRPLTRAKIVH